ncbi:MAG: hypothetical protein JXB49_21840 [Bacteroidales bacterium]|nr:hypothetical protein [Bacteroidales bacterium]
MKEDLKFYLYEMPNSWIFIDELRNKYNISYVVQLEDNCIVIIKNDKSSKKKTDLLQAAEKYENIKFWTKLQLDKFIQVERKKKLHMEN